MTCKTLDLTRPPSMDASCVLFPAVLLGLKNLNRYIVPRGQDRIAG